jgi:hypothetical protein
MTFARTSRCMLTIAFVACAGAACGKKNKGEVDAGGEAVGGRAWITTSTSNVMLGMGCPGETSAPVSFQIYNRGEAAASVQVSITNDEAGEFSATATGCDRLAPGAVCTVAVVFSPKPTGAKVAVLEVSSPGSATLKVTLAAATLAPPAPFSLSASSFDFGSVPVGTLSPAMRMTVTKRSSTKEPCSTASGEQGLLVTVPNDEFVITNDTCSSSDIPIGGTCTFDIAFRPAAAGSRGVSLIVGPRWSQNRIPLLGIGMLAVDASVDADLEDRAETLPDL